MPSLQTRVRDGREQTGTGEELAPGATWVFHARRRTKGRERTGGKRVESAAVASVWGAVCGYIPCEESGQGQDVAGESELPSDRGVGGMDAVAVGHESPETLAYDRDEGHM
jgi:hypothetical protein